MPPVTLSADPALNSGAAAGPRRHGTLKMNVTLKMAQVQLPSGVDVPRALALPPVRAERCRRR